VVPKANGSGFVDARAEIGPLRKYGNQPISLSERGDCDMSGYWCKRLQLSQSAAPVGWNGTWWCRPRSGLPGSMRRRDGRRDVQAMVVSSVSDGLPERCPIPVVDAGEVPVWLILSDGDRRDPLGGIARAPPSGFMSHVGDGARMQRPAVNQPFVEVPIVVGAKVVWTAWPVGRLWIGLPSRNRHSGKSSRTRRSRWTFCVSARLGVHTFAQCDE